MSPLSSAGTSHATDHLLGAVLCRRLTRLGIIRFSLLLAFFIIVLAVVIQMGITLLLRGAVDTVDIVRSVFFGSRRGSPTFSPPWSMNWKTPASV